MQNIRRRWNPFFGGETTTECYLDWRTIALVWFVVVGRKWLSDVEAVKGLVCTNSTVSRGLVKYC